MLNTSAPRYRPGRIIVPATKDRFTNNLPDLSQLLCIIIINSSLSLGHIPKTFKLVVIKPLIKKPKLDPCELANYRPISNLPFMSKILEKVLSAQLCSFLLKKYIYEEFQSGFRLRHTTETALVKIKNDFLRQTKAASHC